METQKLNLIAKFKALPKNQKIFLIVGIVVLLGVIGKADKKNTSSSSYSAPSNSTSQKLTCDECGTSFNKSSGVQLSDSRYPQVFCSNGCATKWGFNHGISVK